MTTKLPTIKQLIDAGAHFGHLRARSHPKAREFTYEVRDRIFVIDLDKTLQQLKQAADYCNALAKQGKTILFVGTKKQAQAVVEQAAKQVDMPFVSTKWLAGMLTNFDEIGRNVRKLERLEKELAENETIKRTKRERVKTQATVDKLHKIFDGIVSLKQLPDALLVVDAAFEKIAVDEARRLAIPVVGIIDTNVDPSSINVPIPANDDSAQAIEKLLGVLTAAIAEGKSKFKPKEVEQKTK